MMWKRRSYTPELKDEAGSQVSALGYFITEAARSRQHKTESGETDN
jgi:hypothetical protein